MSATIKLIYREFDLNGVLHCTKELKEPRNLTYFW